MRSILTLATLLLLIFLGLGWYLDWYRIKRTTSETGHSSFNIDINTDKIRQDVGSKVKQLFSDGNATTPSTSNLPPQTPGVNPQGNPASFRPDGSYVYPGENFTPTPPGSGPRLPTPQ